MDAAIQHRAQNDVAVLGVLSGKPEAGYTFGSVPGEPTVQNMAIE